MQQLGLRPEGWQNKDGTWGLADCRPPQPPPPPPASSLQPLPFGSGDAEASRGQDGLPAPPPPPRQADWLQGVGGLRDASPRSGGTAGHGPPSRKSPAARPPPAPGLSGLGGTGSRRGLHGLWAPMTAPVVPRPAGRSPRKGGSGSWPGRGRAEAAGQQIRAALCHGAAADKPPHGQPGPKGGGPPGESPSDPCAPCCRAAPTPRGLPAPHVEKWEVVKHGWRAGSLASLPPPPPARPTTKCASSNSPSFHEGDPALGDGARTETPGALASAL